MGTVDLILALIQAFPAALTAIENLYTEVKADFSPQDQATIDKAFADAKAADTQKTADADAALAAAAAKG